MTEQEAIVEARNLGDLFPRTNDATLDYFRMIFLRYEQKPVRKAILRYCEFNDEFIDKTKLMAAIQSAVHGGPGGAVTVKLAEVVKESAQKSERQQHEREASANSFNKISAALDRFPPEKLEELKQQVIAKRPDLAPFIRKSNPAASPVLRGLMAELV